MQDTPCWNGKLVSGPGTSDQIGCGLLFEDENNSRFVHTLLKRLYDWISMRFCVDFTLLNHKLLYFVSFYSGFVKSKAFLPILECKKPFLTKYETASDRRRMNLRNKTSKIVNFSSWPRIRLDPHKMLLTWFFAEIHVWLAQMHFGIWITVRLDPDLLKQIGSLKDPWMIYSIQFALYELSVSHSELWQNPPDLRTLILHLRPILGF
jgi:hypothetical protein